MEVSQGRRSRYSLRVGCSAVAIWSLRITAFLVMSSPSVDLDEPVAPISTEFSCLDIAESTKKAIEAMGIEEMTPVQSAVIPAALMGKDILCTAPEVPAVELLIRSQFDALSGTGVIVIAPTRIAAIDLFEVASKLMEDLPTKTVQLIAGGMPRGPEVDKLLRGSNLLVATPGRLLDHLCNTEGFQYDNLQSLVVYQAGSILDMGFAYDLNKIIQYLPETRQTILFSTGLTDQVRNLAETLLNENSKQISVDMNLD